MCVTGAMQLLYQLTSSNHNNVEGLFFHHCPHCVQLSVWVGNDG